MNDKLGNTDENEKYCARVYGLDEWVSERTVKTAARLHHLAVTGECVGFAFAVIMKGNRYARGYTGVTVK